MLCSLMQNKKTENHRNCVNEVWLKGMFPV
jgi:hypothetical protein